MEAKYKKHVHEENVVKYLKFDDGNTRDIPEQSISKQLIVKKHDELCHRGLEPVYYGLKSKYYWPGMKQEIQEKFKEC